MDKANVDKATLRAVLVGMFDLARANRPATVERLAGRLGIGPDLARLALARMEADGLADAKRVRLTLAGLGIATAISEQRLESQVARAA